MRIVKIQISNFRCVQNATLFPQKHNVFLGPNNVGKTAVLEALNLLLNPEITIASQAIDENDFWKRNYIAKTPVSPVATPSAPQESTVGELAPAATETEVEAENDYPPIRVEAVLAGLTKEDEDVFSETLVPWKDDTREVIESTPEGVDPFANAKPAIRVVFEGWYDPDEDDFTYVTYFLTSAGVSREDCSKFTKVQKRHIGFLIYRDFRALTRPITLEPTTLFGRLLSSQEVVPKNFEDALKQLDGSLDPMTQESEFVSLLNAYKAECERFLSLSFGNTSAFSFEVTDRTRSELKHVSQLYVRDDVSLPLQKMGAGTRSLALLSILTLIMRRRGRGILALEEPETFLFPHAQRRVIDECLGLADQTFITTHSPYVLERMPVEAVGRIERLEGGTINWKQISATNIKQINLFSKRLRHGFCEALLGRGVVVVEGDSDRWWLNGASRLLHGATWDGKLLEALELRGIAVVSADTNGDVEKTAQFFCDAGLKVVNVVDLDKNATLVAALCGLPCPTIFFPEKGLEKVLAEGLSVELVRRILAEAPYCKTPLLSASDAAALTDAEARDKLCEMLTFNKGSASMHEWIISQLPAKDVPKRLMEVIGMVSGFIAGEMDFGSLSVC
jgi:putative ATP-dependent endonuclease of OLD family